MTTATAHYFDGRSARLHEAVLEVRAGLLRIATPAMEREVPLDAVRLTEPFAQAPAMLRLADGACCEVPPGAGRDALLAALGYRKSAVERWQARWWAALLALVLLATLLGLLYLQGLPWLARLIAPTLPPAMEAQFGDTALRSLQERGLLQGSRLSEQRIAEVRALLPLALPEHPRVPVHLLVRSSSLGANAISLPNGAIVVTDALVRLMQTPDNQLDAAGKARLLAVLGHEVGHLERRHVGRALVGTSLTAALSATLFGDFSAVAASVPTLLTNMAYSRDMELEADDYAVTVLRRNGMPPTVLADALEALERQHRKARKEPWLLVKTKNYLSTHPANAERIARLRASPAK